MSLGEINQSAIAVWILFAGMFGLADVITSQFGWLRCGTFTVVLSRVKMSRCLWNNWNRNFQAVDVRQVIKNLPEGWLKESKQAGTPPFTLLLHALLQRNPLYIVCKHNIVPSVHLWKSNDTLNCSKGQGILVPSVIVAEKWKCLARETEFPSHWWEILSLKCRSYKPPCQWKWQPFWMSLARYNVALFEKLLFLVHVNCILMGTLS